jgi:transposase
MKKSTSLYFTEANKGKLLFVRKFLDECLCVLNQFVKTLWYRQQFIGKFAHLKTQTWLSAAMRQALGSQALALVKSQRRRAYPRMPIQRKSAVLLDQRTVKLAFDQNSFDAWITLSGLGNGVKVSLPARKHRHFNSLLSLGWNLKKSVRLHPDHVDVFFEKRFEPNGNDRVVGYDLGFKKLFTSSDGEMVGQGLEAKMEKIARKQKGSKAYERALAERDNYINHEIKKLNMDIGTAVVENLKGLKSNIGARIMLSSGKREAWTYAKAIKRFKTLCGDRGVLLRKVNPKYTSQTCSKCGVKDKHSRNGEQFCCVACGYTTDADFNASCNIRSKYLESKACRLCKTDLQDSNRDGLSHPGELLEDDRGESQITITTVTPCHTYTKGQSNDQ